MSCVVVQQMEAGRYPGVAEACTGRIAAHLSTEVVCDCEC